MQITPQSHPSLFRTIQVAGYSYFVRFRTDGITVGLKEDLDELYEQTYRDDAKVPAEVPTDWDALQKWLSSPRGARKCDTAAAKLLFIPATADTPAMEGDILDYLSREDLSRALGFFEKDYDSNTSVQQGSIAST